jgi:hypothetical protein
LRQNLIDENGLDGLAYNVRRYQPLPHVANSTDVKRAENTKEFISNMLTQTDCFKKKVSNLRSNLFNPETLTVKPYQTSELEFHDSLMKGIEGSTKTLTRKLDNVIYVSQQLKAKLYPAVVMNVKEKRSKMRKKENTKKMKNRKK